MPTSLAGEGDLPEDWTGEWAVEYRAACPDHPGKESYPSVIRAWAEAKLAGECCHLEQRPVGLSLTGPWTPVPIEEGGEGS